MAAPAQSHAPYDPARPNPHGFHPGVMSLENEGAYAVMDDVRQLEKEGHTILNFGPGQPDFPTPQHVKDAGIAAITGNQTTYTNPSGTAELKAQISAFMNRTRKLPEAEAVLDANVVIGPGAKPPLFFAAQCLLQPGDEVLIPDPGFPAYKALAQACSCSFRFIPWLDNTFDLAALEASLSDKTRMIIINSPSNPTGGVMPKEDLDKVMAMLEAFPRCWVLSDEIYSQLTYDGIGTPSSALSYPSMRERTIAVDGFSKTYCMTGWRLGWAIMPAPLAERVHLFMTHAIGCSASFTQIAGIAALSGPQDMLTEMVAEYQKRRDYVVGRLNAMPGVTCKTPMGAFYVFPDVSGVGVPCKEIQRRLLFEGHLVCLPGTDFGAVGEGHLRYSYVRAMEKLVAGMDKTEEIIKKIVAEQAA